MTLSKIFIRGCTSALIASTLLAPALIGCGWPVGSDTSSSRNLPETSRELPGAPRIEDLTVWRPYFNTTAGSVEAGKVIGTAFTTRLSEAESPVVVTALHHFGVGSGLDRELNPSELRRVVQRGFSSDAFGMSDRIFHLGQVRSFPIEAGDAAAEQRWIDLDVAVFEIGNQLPKRWLELGDVAPALDQRIWLVTAVFGGAPATQKCHPARVISSDSTHQLSYRFENTNLSLEATEGAALVSDDGFVIGIHLGGEATATHVEGWGVTATAFKDAWDAH